MAILAGSWLGLSVHKTLWPWWHLDLLLISFWLCSILGSSKDSIFSLFYPQMQPFQASLSQSKLSCEFQTPSQL